jgi:hypothetical protein
MGEEYDMIRDLQRRVTALEQGDKRNGDQQFAFGPMAANVGCEIGTFIACQCPHVKRWDVVSINDKQVHLRITLWAEQKKG